MVVSISIVVILGVAVFFTVRSGGHKGWHAGLATLFGIYLASTSVGAPVRHLVAQITSAITHISF